MNSALRNHHWVRLLVLSVACLAGSCASINHAQAPTQPKPGPEPKKLEIWAGEWNYEGDGQETPFMPGGKFKGRESSKMVLNGFFLETQWRDTGDSGYVAQGTVMTSFDSARMYYTEHNFENDGSVTMTTSTINGSTWSGTGSRVDSKGKAYKTRSQRTLAADGKSYTSKVEYSADEGLTWKPWFELNARKARL